MRNITGTSSAARVFAAFFMALGLFAGAVVAQEAAKVQAKEFGFEDVAAKAKKLASARYKDNSNYLPEFMRGMGYDQWRGIRFKPMRSLWKNHGLYFTVQFFHPGFLFNRPVRVNIIEGARVKRVPFSQDFFDYGKEQKIKASMPKDLDFAGFRLHCPINRDDYYDECAVFLGASYFRAVAKGQHYGLSSRALAIDTALPKGEEFPYFKEFWIKKPQKEEKAITVYALLDSPSMTGAYTFVITPGTSTVFDVQGMLFQREKVKKLGIAPLTSMFYYGENSNLESHIRDFRPEVHDSDGLYLKYASGEWLWRPLVNPPFLFVNEFKADGVKGFGILQRDTAFSSYQDLEARYELRPSVWIKTGKGMDKGSVELVQIPTRDEYNDNIVAFFVPDEKALEASSPFEFSYSMYWMPGDRPMHPGARVAASMVCHGREKGVQKFIVDFVGGNLFRFPAAAKISPVLTVPDNLEILENIAMKNPITGGVRVVFQVRPKDSTFFSELVSDRPKQASEMRLFLKYGKHTLSETWSSCVFY